MLDRLLIFVAAMAPIGALLTGIGTFAVVMSWVVWLVTAGWRKPLERPFGPLPKSELPEPSRVPAISTGGMAVALAVVAVKLAPKPEAVVWAVVAAVLAVLTVVVLLKPPITPKF